MNHQKTRTSGLADHSDMNTQNIANVVKIRQFRHRLIDSFLFFFQNSKLSLKNSR